MRISSNIPTNDHIVLINRTHEKAKNIAGKFNVLVKEYGELPTEIRKADVMIVATGAQLPTGGERYYTYRETAVNFGFIHPQQCA